MAITANDEPTEIEADVDKRFSSIIVNLPVQQTGTGTPSPSNPRPFTMWTDVSLYVSDAETANEPTLTITLPTPMYGGKVDMVRGEIATMYNSKESGTDWEMTEEGQFRCQVSAYNNGDETSTNVADLYAVHYETVSNKDAYDATDDLTCGLATIDGTTYLYVNDAQYTTLETFATHIAEEVFVFRAHIPMSDVTEPHIVYLHEGTSYVWAEGAYYVETVVGIPPLTLPNSVGKPLNDWIVELGPYQDLHGYDNPWPAGGGKNLIDVADFSGDTSGSTLKVIVPEITLSAGTYTLSWTQTSDITSNTRNTPAYKVVGGSYVYLLASENALLGSGRKNWTITLGEDSTITIAYWTHTISPACDYVDFQLESGSIATDFAPYSNICPILGTDKLNIFVEESYDQSATPKAVITIPTLGKNLLNPDARTTDQGGNRIRWYYDDGFTLKANQPYTFSVSGTTQTIALYIVNKSTGTSFAYGNVSISYTSTEDVIVYFQAYRGEPILDANNFQLELGSSASSYEPFTNTLYGGTYDPVTGQGTITRAIVDMGTLSWSINGDRFNVATVLAPEPLRKNTWDINNPMAICSLYKYGNISNGNGVDKSIGFYNSYLYARDTAYSDANDFKAAVTGAQLVYKLNTPIPFSTDGHTITTPKGTASTWATAEDGTVDSMEVTYVAKPT